MNWFKFLQEENTITNSDHGILGLSHLENYTEPIQNPVKLKKFEWRRKLKSTAGNNKFKIKYYGKPHRKYQTLISRTDFAPQKLIAIDNQTKEEILLFDGCKHGYNAMMCDNYSKEQIKNREVEEIYRDKQGNEIFEIILSAYYQIDYEDEFREDLDASGNIKIINGDKIDFEELKRNGCDYLSIFAINGSGQKIEILSEELS